MSLFTINNATINLNIPADLQARIGAFLTTSTSNEEQIAQEIQTMTAQLQRLTDDVAAMKTQSASLIALTGGLAAQIRELKDDPAALAALADDVEANTAAISAAVTANTDVPPTPPTA